MAGIVASHQGSFKTPKKVFASHGGSWVEVPMGSGGTPANPTWTRPSEWLATNVTAGEQKIQLLVAVYPNTTNHLAIKVSGAFTIDWGDGTAPANYATASTPTHEYLWANVGNDTSEGWRQALVTITPQAGQTLTLLDTTYGPKSLRTYPNPIIEIVTGPSTITTFAVYRNYGAFTRTFSVRHIEFKSALTLSGLNLFYDCRALEAIDGTINLTTSGSSLFQYCYKLVKYPVLNNTASIATWTNAFAYNHAMVVPPTISIAGATTSLLQMFQGCYSMAEIPAWFIPPASVTSLSNTFQNCSSIETTPLFDTSTVTSFATTFAGCTSLRSVAAYNTSAAMTMASMFSTCSVLESVPAFNTSNVTNMSSMFLNCYMLRSVPSLDTAKVTGSGLTSLFSGCTSLTDIPTINVGLATSLSSIIYACSNLRKVTFTGAMSQVTAASNMCQDCTLLEEINADLDFSGVTSITGAFGNLYSLRVLKFAAGKGPKITWTIASSMLDTAMLDAVYASLPTITAQTMTITGVWGGDLATKATATAKGWTVTGP